MTYLDNDMKFVCVVNRKVPIPTLMNAIAHSVNGLAIEAKENGAEFLTYPNAADGFASTISKSPYIILMAKNSSQLQSLRRSADDLNIAHNTFVSAMIGPDAETQQKETLEAENEGLEYWTVALYGNSETLQPLTKRFSLYRPPS